MAELLSQEADRGDELEAKVARSDKAATRWERKYLALKEGVDAFVQSAKLERDRARQEQAVLKSLIEEHTVLKLELDAAQEDAKLNLRETVRLRHELSAALEAGHVDRIQTADCDCGALSGADEDKREEEEEDDDNDDDDDEDVEDDDGDDSDDSAERLRDELLAFAGEPSLPESRKPVTERDDAGEVVVTGVVGDDTNKLAAMVCTTVGCRRRSNISAEFHDELGRSSTDTACCYECITGDGHSEACGAVAAAETERQRQLARTSVGASATDGGGDDEGTFQDASVFVPPPVAGTPTKSTAADPRAPGASNPGSPLNMDFLSRRSESQRALDDSADFASGLVEAGVVADGAGVMERAALGLQPLPPGKATWASPSGHWEPCTALLQLAADPIMHLVRQAPGGARGAVHLLLPEWAVRPFAAQELNTRHPFKERPLHVPWAPSHLQKCDAHGDGLSRRLPVWVPLPSHPMHNALWSGEGLDASGNDTGHLGMVPSDLRCSVVPADRLLAVADAEARGTTLAEVESTAGRRVMARSTSVHLEVREEPKHEAHDDEGSASGWSDGSAAANERDEGLCDNLMKLRRFAEGFWRASSRAGSSARTQCSFPAVLASSWKPFQNSRECSLMTQSRRRRFMLASLSSFSVVCGRTSTRTRALHHRLGRLRGVRSAVRRRRRRQRLRCLAHPRARARRELVACE